MCIFNTDSPIKDKSKQRKESRLFLLNRITEDLGPPVALHCLYIIITILTINPSIYLR